MGSVFALGFSACFVTMMVIFFRGFTDYVRISTSGDILESGNLERLTAMFPKGMFIGLLVAAVVIYLASAIHLSRSSARTKE